MIRVEKFLVLIGLDLHENEGVEVTVLKIFSLDDLLKGGRQTDNKMDINSLEKYTVELNFKVTATSVFQALLFVGGNKGELQYFDLTN